jgi:hypothetical protein
MNVTPWVLEVALPGKRHRIFVGPVFAASPEMVQRRAAALLRRTALRALDAENPLVCDRVVETATAMPAYCTLYDLSCFASTEHPDYFSCSRFTQNIRSLNAFLKSSRGFKTLQDLRTRY